MRRGLPGGAALAAALALAAAAACAQETTWDCQVVGPRQSSYFQPAAITVRIDSAGGPVTVDDELVRQISVIPLRAKLEQSGDRKVRILWTLKDLADDPARRYAGNGDSTTLQRLTITATGEGLLVTTIAPPFFPVVQLRAPVRCSHRK